MVKAIFFDIDGTLVSFETHKIPASTQEALKTLRDKGIKIFIATGRPQCLINNLGDLEFDGVYHRKRKLLFYRRPPAHL